MGVAIKEIMKYSPLFFYGKTSSGKARLLKDIAESFNQINKKTCLYATAKAFSKDLLLAVKNRRVEQFQQKYRNNSLLIINDLQFLAGKVMVQQELLKILKEFQIKDHQIILAANRHPKCIPGLDKDLVDSCYGGLILEINQKLKW